MIVPSAMLASGGSFLIKATNSKLRVRPFISHTAQKISKFMTERKSLKLFRDLVFLSFSKLKTHGNLKILLYCFAMIPVNISICRVVTQLSPFESPY